MFWKQYSVSKFFFNRKRFLCVLHMAIFKYQKYLAINIDFVNVFKIIFCFKNFFNRKRFLCVLPMAIFKYEKYLAFNIDFVNILKKNFDFINFSW